MAGNVIRQDVVQIAFNTDIGGLTKAANEVDNLKKNLSGGIGEDAFGDMAKEAKNAGKGVEGVNKEIGDTNDNLDDTKKKGDKAFTSLKKLASISFKVIAAGIAAAAGAVGVLIKNSVSAYAEFEQLEGGMKKIFDQADQKGIMQDANNAYKDLGLSANDYLRIINDTGANFAATMGDQKGYETAKTGLTAISDYASGTGKNVDELSAKFSMITRSAGSYQSIADQFSGILPATSKDFLKQAQKAGLLSEKYSELTKVPVAEYQEAVSKMLQKGVKDLGLAGNTAAEAESTISGSIGMTKAAWSDLQSSFIKGGDDFDRCMQNMVDSVKALAKNITPALKSALSGIGDMITELAPIIEQELPTIIEELLPPLLKAAGSIVVALIKALPSIINALVEAAPEIIRSLGEALSETFGEEFPAIKAFGEFITKNAEPITKMIPYIIGLVAAFKGFNILKSFVSPMASFAKSIGSMAGKLKGGLGGKLADTAKGTTQAGEAAKSSSSGLLNAAKAFMMMGAAVLMIALGFGILAAASIALANAGWGAIAVMIGMVGALAALGFGMMVLLKSLSTAGPMVSTAGTAMLQLGIAVLLVAAGFAILTFASIALANAGWGAIAVMVGMLAAIAGLAIGAAALAPALAAGAAGLIAFGAAIVLVGVGALLAAASLAIIAAILPTLVQYGAAGAVAIAALGAGLTVFALGAALAGAAAMILGAGLLVLTAALLPLSAVLLIITAAMTLFAAVFVLLSAAAVLFSAAFVALVPAFTALAASTPIFAKALGSLTKPMAKLIIPAGLLVAAMAPLAVEFTALAVGALAVLAAITGLVVTTTALAALFMRLASVSMMLPMLFTMLGAGATRLASALAPLKASLMAMVAPLGVVSAQFTRFAVAITIVATAATVTAAKFAIIITLVTGVGNAFTRLLSIVPTVTAAISRGFSAMVLAVTVNGAKMISVFGKTMQGILMVVKRTNLAGAGTQMMNGLILGMNSRRSAAISTARSIAQAINKEYAKVQKIHSPSKVWEDYGANQIQGDIKGMEKTVPKLESTVQDVGKAATPYSSTYTPENSTYYSSSRNSEVNTYSPQFNLTISGSNDDRILSRKVKRWIAQAMDETFESFERKNPKLVEV